METVSTVTLVIILDIPSPMPVILFPIVSVPMETLVLHEKPSNRPSPEIWYSIDSVSLSVMFVYVSLEGIVRSLLYTLENQIPTMSARMYPFSRYSIMSNLIPDSSSGMTAVNLLPVHGSEYMLVIPTNA